MSNEQIDARFKIEAKLPTDVWEHMETLREYSLQCPRSVEFGVYDCTTTWALLAGHPQKLVSYDLVRRPEVDEVEQAASDSTTKFTFVQGNTIDVEIEETDLLFIDSHHSYAHLKRELELHADRVVKFIVLHDTTIFAETDQTYTGRGLWPAIEEFLAAKPEWKLRQRFTNCHGLTVLERA